MQAALHRAGGAPAESPWPIFSAWNGDLGSSLASTSGWQSWIAGAAEYSVYSAPDEPLPELIRMPGGLLAALRRCRAGEVLEVEGLREFLLPRDPRAVRVAPFVATGTGIAPFHCFARSCPGLDCLPCAGVAQSASCMGPRTSTRAAASCLSREQVGWKQGATFEGRVTDFLRAHPPPAERLFYLCGGCDMIYEVFAILRRRGVPAERIFAEVYF
jgi:ferredoxin--NADP+ reductase/benzoate/toluate 1,2-dioxygenase reductase subunit